MAKKKIRNKAMAAHKQMHTLHENCIRIKQELDQSHVQ